MRLIFACALLASSIAAAQPCTFQWSTAFPQDGPSATVRATTQFDPDGPGPQPPLLIIAGDFTTIGTTSFSHVAAWDGSQWLPMGPGLNNSVECLVVLDPDGPGPLLESLLAGLTSNNTQAVVRWTGGTWVPVGNGIGDTVSCIAVYDDDADGPHVPMLYAGGRTVGFGYIARFDGVNWNPVGPALNGWVYGLTSFDDDGPGPHQPVLVVGGDFTTAGEVSTPHIAQWNGAAWSALGAGVNGRVWTVTSFDDDGAGPNLPTLYAGGTFYFTGSPINSGIAQWTGSSWTQVGTRLSGYVISLTSMDDDGPGPNPASLIAVGGFSLANVVPAPRVAARLSGGDWLGLALGLNTTAYACSPWDPDGDGPLPPRLVVGGFFANAPVLPGPSTFTPHIAQWDGAAWTSTGPATNRGTDDMVFDLISCNEDGSQRLFAAGDFTAVAGVPASHIARFDGTSWSPLGPGLNNRIYNLTTFDEDGTGPLAPALIAAGAFSKSGAEPIYGVARWNGAAWSSFGAGPTTMIVYAAAAADLDGPGPNPPRLFAGGYDFGSNSSVRVWNGATWSSIPGLGGTARALIEFDPDEGGPQPPLLIAGGTLNLTGSPGTVLVAAWNGATWSALGSMTLSYEVDRLTIYDDDGPGPHPARLLAGGELNGGVRAWDGASWLALGAGLGTSARVYSMTTLDDDGDGIASLFVGGSFNSSIFPPFPVVTVRSAAKWNGAAWSSLGTGVNDFLMGLAAFDEDGPGPRAPALYAGGRFTLAGGKTSGFIGRWGCGDPLACYPNCDQSTTAPVLNINDFQCFVNSFAAGSPYANCDHSTVPPVLNVNDFQCFVNAFAAACP